jgi:hypothetical protein
MKPVVECRDEAEDVGPEVVVLLLVLRNTGLCARGLERFAIELSAGNPFVRSGEGRRICACEDSNGSGGAGGVG